METANNTPALLAGVAAGEIGLLVFLTIHHFTIRPIWFILLPGAAIAAVSGAAVGWAFHILRPTLPQNIWLASLMLAGLLTLTQVPGFLLGAVREPLIDMTTATLLPGKGQAAFMAFFLELFLTAALVGGLIGWGLAREARSAGVMALAAVLFALGPGHNIPFFAGTSGAGKMWMLMGAFITAAALAFPAALTLFTRLDN
ncbi:MAG: hypothetical protein EPO32_06545 [Anaerolineae bacterium]|nr:MAG: hypothetical protein EPO32_06545 [Anaerolineae bacterium]